MAEFPNIVKKRFNYEKIIRATLQKKGKNNNKKKAGKKKKVSFIHLHRQTQ